MGDLTENFSKAEFASVYRGVTTQVPAALMPNLQRLANNLQVLRDAAGRPIGINSGYRTPEHNRAVGGALSSQHLDAHAADFTIAGLTPNEAYCMTLGLIVQGAMREGGLGAYRKHTHYDPRGTPARWTKGVPEPDCRGEVQPQPPEQEEDEDMTFPSYVTRTGDLKDRVYYVEAGRLQIIEDGDQLKSMRRLGLLADRAQDVSVADLHQLRVKYGHTK